MNNTLESKRSPLILTERTEHLEILENRFKNFVKNIFVLRGGMRKKQREYLMEEITTLPSSAENKKESTLDLNYKLQEKQIHERSL